MGRTESDELEETMVDLVSTSVLPLHGPRCGIRHGAQTGLSLLINGKQIRLSWGQSFELGMERSEAKGGSEKVRGFGRIECDALYSIEIQRHGLPGFPAVSFRAIFD